MLASSVGARDEMGLELILEDGTWVAEVYEDDATKHGQSRARRGRAVCETSGRCAAHCGVRIVGRLRIFGCWIG